MPIHTLYVQYIPTQINLSTQASANIIVIVTYHQNHQREQLKNNK